MSAAWTDAIALLSAVHTAEFEAAFDAVAEPGGATIIPYPILCVRLRHDVDEMVLLMALSHVGQNYRTAPGIYSFPAEWADEVRDILRFHHLRAAVVPSVAYRLELQNPALLNDLRDALLGLAPTFGPTYPRIAVI